jgi:large subunit ribosomal protein L15
VVNLRQLEELEGSEFGPEELRRLGLIGSGSRPVKILGDGRPGRALTVRAHAFSAAARERIEAAGGAAELIELIG